MRKILLSFTILLVTAVVLGQTLKPVQIDSLVTVSLPAGYQKKDTLNQQIFSANGLLGYVVVIRAVNDKNNAPLKKERDLSKVLKEYVKGIQRQSAGGSAQNVRDTTIGTLEAKNFTLKTDDGNGVQFRNFILLYTQDATYTFEYVYPENRKDIIKDEFKAFASSIRLSPELQRNDQYLSMAKGLSSINKLILFGVAGVIIIIVLIVITRTRRKRRKS